MLLVTIAGEFDLAEFEAQVIDDRDVELACEGQIRFTMEVAHFYSRQTSLWPTRAEAASSLLSATAT